MAADNLREFEIGLLRWAEERVPEDVRDLRDAIALEALRGVVTLTPVDTGRLRGNWQLGVGYAPEGHDPERLDPGGADTIRAGQDTLEVARQAKGNPYSPVWIHNGVPYGAYVNDGTERTRAVHMLEQTVERLSRRFA